MGRSFLKKQQEVLKDSGSRLKYIVCLTGAWLELRIPGKQCRGTGDVFMFRMNYTEKPYSSEKTYFWNEI